MFVNSQASCYSAYLLRKLGEAVLSWNCLCASKLAQRDWCREWVFLIPTSGRTTPTKGGVVSLSGIPSSGTYRHSQGSRAPPWSGVVHTLSDCRYDISQLYCVVDLIYYT